MLVSPSEVVAEPARSGGSPSPGKAIDLAEVEVVLEEPARPAFLARSGPGNRHVPPERWALSLDQWFQFVDACAASPEWSDIVAEKGYADLYKINQHFVKPWTRRTGSSVSLLMNPDRPLEAKVMVSHSWAGDIQQSREALRLWAQTSDIPSDLELWFCLLCNYQPGDEIGDGGPTVAEQLSLDPFGHVIRCVRDHLGMVVLHTSTAELYSRLWCVFEIDQAVDVGARTYGIASCTYLSNIHDTAELAVDTASAKCSVEADEAMIRTRVDSKGGFARLSSTVLQFRLGMALSCTSRRGKLECCRKLLDAAADPNMPDGLGRTCLHRAAYACNLELVELLVDSGADRALRDVEGSCPAHLVPLLVKEDISVRLFRILVSSYEVAVTANVHSMRPFDRFKQWAQTATGNTHYVAGMACVNELEDRWPLLRGERAPPLSRRMTMPLPGSSQWRAWDHDFRGRRVRAYTWSAGQEARGDALALSFTLPWSMSRDALQPMAELLSSYCKVSLHVLTYESVVAAIDQPIEDFSKEVADLVEALPLAGPVFVIEDSEGNGALVPWSLRKALAGVVMISPMQFYGWDFLGTAQHEEQVQILAKFSRMCLEQSVRSILALGDLVYLDNAQELAAVDDELTLRTTEAGPDWFRTQARWLAWGGREKAEAFHRLPPLRSVPALILCGAQSPPASGTESVLRFRRRLLPQAELVFIKKSKIWWKLEGAEQSEAVARVVADFVQRTLADLHRGFTL